MLLDQVTKRPSQSKDLYRLLRTLKRSDPAWGNAPRTTIYRDFGSEDFSGYGQRQRQMQEELEREREAALRYLRHFR